MHIINLLEHYDVFAISRILSQSQHGLNPEKKTGHSRHVKLPPLKQSFVMGVSFVETEDQKDVNGQVS